MPCFQPVKAWRGRTPSSSGRARLVFKKEDSCGIELEVPCGRCVGCRLDRSREWAVRCLHEAQTHDQNCFLTLTYDADHLPIYGSLVPHHLRNFLRRLRRYYANDDVRYFACGEYGEGLSRPHYHACVFGIDFEDKKKFSRSEAGSWNYESPTLTALWPHGFALAGELNWQTAAYTARYVMKKVGGDKAAEHYGDREPEFIRMSLKPGIGARWFERYGNSVSEHDTVVANGSEMKVPRYYDKLRERQGENLEVVKKQRRKRALERAADHTPERLRVREMCAQFRARKLKRELESENQSVRDLRQRSGRLPAAVLPSDCVGSD